MDCVINIDNDTVDNITGTEHVNRIVLLDAIPSDDGSNDYTEYKIDVAITIQIILVFTNNVHYI